MAQNEDPNQLLKVYKQSDDFRRQAIYHIASLPKLSLFDLAQLAGTINHAVEALESSNNSQLMPLAQLMRQHKTLVLNNNNLEEQFGTSLLDKSLRETVMWVAVHQYQELGLYRKGYKLSEKQFWKWAVDGLGEAQEWDKLEHFAREQKAPYGYLPLIKVLVNGGQKSRAMKFMDKIVPADQPAAYELLGWVF